MRFVLLAAVLVLALSGCGEDDVRERVDDARTQVEKQVEKQVERAKDEFEERRERFGERIDEVLGDIQRAVPRAERTDPSVRSRGRNRPQTIDEFLVAVLHDVDEYWTTTFEEAGLPEPRVRFVAVPPGQAVRTGCGSPAGDDAAFYCPADDTIYVAQVFAAQLYQGVAHGLPGESTGFGRAAGDFAVAYVLAHEYAHNLQTELGIFDNRVTQSAKPFELQADCFAGTWANSAYRRGELGPGDLEEAADTALAVGDFDFGNAQHHGTPQERREALLTGFESGDPSVCARYVEAA